MEVRRSVLDATLHEVVSRAGSETMFAGIPDGKQQLSVFSTDTAVGRRPARLRVRQNAPRKFVSVKIQAQPGQLDTVVSALSDMEVQVRSFGPQVLLADVPIARLAELAALGGVTRIEAPRQFYHRMNEALGPISNANLAMTQHPDLHGEGVIVGIVDSGIDWKHEDFRNESGKTRLELLIHAQEGEEPMTCLCETYSADQINEALATGLGVPHGDPHGHGTHCASIAAGNGSALADKRYSGVAPQATLMGARLDSLSDVNIIDSIRRIFAAAGDRPAVVNLSLGSNIGPHDGTSAIENVIAQETGPGRIIVVAAGNEARDRIHFGGTLVENQDLDIEFTIRDELQAISLWVPRGDEITAVALIDHDDNSFPISGSEQNTTNGAFLGWLNVDPVNGDFNVELRIAANSIGRRWKLRLSAGAVLNGKVHAWAETWIDPGAARAGIFMLQHSPEFTLGMPGTEERAIVVGALTSRESILPDGSSLPGLRQGNLAPFSSHGPTRMGVQRPDVVAPGQWIVAAMAANSSASESDDFEDRRLPGGKYISFQGTSMSTPFVTGVIALMLQREPHLTPEEIRLRLRASAIRDTDTGGVWNSGFGYGKVDVQALLNYALA